MSFEAIQNYFVDGWQILVDQAQLSVSNFATVFNLVTALDILFLLLILWWLWTKIRKTNLVRVLPAFLALLVILLVSKLLGFIALFYVSAVLLVVLLVAAVLIYNQELQQIVELSLNGRKNEQKVKTLSQHERADFVRELADTIITLAKSKTPALLVIRVTKPISRLVENGTPLYTPLKKEFVLDIFSRRSRLSNGAMIIDNGMVAAVGSTLTLAAPKRFVFSLSNPAIKQVAMHWEAIVVITHKHTDTLSLLHKDQSYSKLTAGSLERVIKNILIAKQ
ncbi:hypothetical protein A2V68_02775 [candidate division Kazan bacterium RBG_13_50_9]|uniref:DAC domain-containing protein n=1 Tax=candidate division Kazan bacterium RBG_13_50_9 TaxID=1798535 RepID=A0A1F4NST6_UNCK3|nr:MAG: hypothetical protein A2V68_02775 [candidate division Kazan bacterium RBG_13_50_9]